jgi:hypothetical protein
VILRLGEERGIWEEKREEKRKRRMGEKEHERRRGDTVA